MLEASNHVKSSSPLLKKDMFNRPGDLYKQMATPLHGAPPSGSGRIVAKDTVDQPLLDRSLNVTDAIAIDTASNEVLAAKIMRGDATAVKDVAGAVASHHLHHLHEQSARAPKRFLMNALRHVVWPCPSLPVSSPSHPTPATIHSLFAVNRILRQAQRHQASYTSEYTHPIKQKQYQKGDITGGRRDVGAEHARGEEEARIDKVHGVPRGPTFGAQLTRQKTWGSAGPHVQGANFTKLRRWWWGHCA
jgi:hypothetical protein